MNDADPNTSPPALGGLAAGPGGDVAALPAPASSATLAFARWMLPGLSLVSLVSLILALALWQKLGAIQEQLARQSADAGAAAAEARAVAKQSAELARDTAARLALTDARVSESALQRTQLEELMQSLSRSRDENLVVDIESAVRLAQQQAQLTGSVEPLLAALKTADQRLQRAAQPRLGVLQRAIARDLGRIQSTALADTPALLVKMDELIRSADDIPLANAVGGVSLAKAAPASAAGSTGTAKSAWWAGPLDTVQTELRNLVRVSRVEQPEAALLSPEQAFFVRENLKLKLLNARLGLLARQLESARADIASASQSLSRYFDASSRKTQATATLLQQVQAQMRILELPRVDETLAALATAAAGR
jgi:uroporphyrin-3 C-methyltransferase